MRTADDDPMDTSMTMSIHIQASCPEARDFAERYWRSTEPIVSFDFEENES